MAGRAKQLNEQQRIFVDAYQASTDASRAYKAAGYKASKKNVAKNAQRLLSSPIIQGELKRRAKVAQAVAVAKAAPAVIEPVATLDERLQILTTIARNGKASNFDRIMAVVELCKIQGEYKHFEKRQTVNIFNSLTDDQLREIGEPTDVEFKALEAGNDPIEPPGA